MPRVQTVSINKVRADALVVMRGYVGPAILSIYALGFVLIWPILRDLPHVDLAPLRSPVVWLLIVWTVAAGVFAARYGSPLEGRMTTPSLWIVVIGDTLTAIGVAAFVAQFLILLAKLAHGDVPSLLVVAAPLTLLSAIILYWMLLSPSLAAMRLLVTNLVPDGAPLPTVLASPVAQRHTGEAVTYPKKRSSAAVACRVAARVLGAVTAGLALWLFVLFIKQPVSEAYESAVEVVPALVLMSAAAYFVRALGRRGRQHAALDANAALLNDRRRPILYLRSFQDDPYLMDHEWDSVMRTRYGRAERLRRPSPIATMFTGGGRLEEGLARVVAPIGPLVAIGAPDEPLPQLGASRAYFTNDTWQSAIIDWVDTAQLIIKVAGPTQWIRWEFDTILDRNAWPKLLVLMPPSTREDHAARWGNIVGALQDGPWGDAVASLDPREVVAMRLLDEGALSVVTSNRRRMVDYVLAVRIMLHQMQTAVPI
jgi:hypothetical protein